MDILPVKGRNKGVIELVDDLMRHLVPKMFDVLHEGNFFFIDLVVGDHFREMGRRLNGIIRLFVKKIEKAGFFRKKEAKSHRFLLYRLQLRIDFLGQNCQPFRKVTLSLRRDMVLGHRGLVK